MQGLGFNKGQTLNQFLKAEQTLTRADVVYQGSKSAMSPVRNDTYIKCMSSGGPEHMLYLA